VRKGVPYLVGEAGRELFVPGQDGRIVPNHRLGSGGSGGGGFGSGDVYVSLNLTYAPGFSAGDREEFEERIAPLFTPMIRKAIEHARAS
jgi:hypothetical protein